MFTRMLYSIATTELAPASFYEPGPDGKRAHAHYDGLPVDFIAGAMIGIGARGQPGIHTYNVVNHHHDDGISLDSVVDWIESAGYAVERVRDHAGWLKRFETKLNALTEAQRQHSSIAILGMFKQPYPASEAPIGCEHFIAAVRELPIGPDVPHLDEAYIHKYLDDMRRLGLLSEARRKADAIVANQKGNGK
jgi:fatty acid CoA ligase FadD9